MSSAVRPLEQDQTNQGGERPMPCLEVTYTDHQVGHYPINPEEGWRVDAALRMLVIGRGVPRKMVPLDNVQLIELVEPHVRPPMMPVHEAEDLARNAVLQPHVREQTDQGPDICRTCSEAVADWVAWPCNAVRSALKATS